MIDTETRERIRASARDVAAAAPPLTPEQRQFLAALLEPVRRTVARKGTDE